MSVYLLIRQSLASLIFTGSPVRSLHQPHCPLIISHRNPTIVSPRSTLIEAIPCTKCLEIHLRTHRWARPTHPLQTKLRTPFLLFFRAPALRSSGRAPSVLVFGQFLVSSEIIFPPVPCGILWFLLFRASSVKIAS